MKLKHIVLICISLFAALPISCAQPIAWLWEQHAKNNFPTPVAMKKLFMEQAEALASTHNNIPLKTGNTVRVMSYNVFEWRNAEQDDSLKGILKDIETCNPDIIIFQEATIDPNNNDYPIAKLKAAGFTNHTYCDAKGSWVSPRKFVNLLVSRYPLKETKGVAFSAQSPLSKEERCYIRTAIDLGNHEVVIYGTHLDVWDNSGATRVKQVEELFEAIDKEKNKHVLVAADFNETSEAFYQNSTLAAQPLWNFVTASITKYLGFMPTYLIHQNFNAKGFRNCFAACNKQHPSWTVWTGTAVDTMYISPQWSWPVTNAFVYYTAASDHLPICMDFIPGIQATSTMQKPDTIKNALALLRLRLLALAKQILK